MNQMKNSKKKKLYLLLQEKTYLIKEIHKLKVNES